MSHDACFPVPPSAETGGEIIREPGSDFSTGYPLTETTLALGGCSWSLTSVTDQDALIDSVRTESDLERFPYGLILWASALGLAARLASEAERARLPGARVLELGAGVGLPGLVARQLGADVTQTDYQEAALGLAARNARQNGVTGIEHLLADWRAWPPDARCYDLVLGSDVLYERALHDDLFRLFPRLLRPGGRVLLSDPLRPQALAFVDRMERDGDWGVRVEGEFVDWEGSRREIALFTLERR
jgi:predicted nicotinamide N-methyase